MLPFELEVIAVDSAKAMVERARELVPDPRIEWQVAQGEECVARYTSSFDLITCGAAFWHLDPRAYAAMMDALRPTGRLVFNVPVAQCAGEAATRHPIQAAIADLLAEQRGTFPAIHPRFDRRAFDDAVSSARQVMRLDAFSLAWSTRGAGRSLEDSSHGGDGGAGFTPTGF